MPKKAEILRVRRFTDDTLVGLMRDAETGADSDFFAETKNRRLADLAEGDRVVYRLEPNTKSRQIVRILTPKSNEVTLEHQVTGRQVDLKMGFSWTTLFGAPFLGAPLLQKGLRKPAIFMSALVGTHLLVIQNSPMVESHGRTLHAIGGVALAPEVFSLLTGVMLCLELAACVYMASHANRWQALALVRRGYLLHGATNEAKISFFHSYIGATARSAGYGPKIAPEGQGDERARAGAAKGTISRGRLKSIFSRTSTVTQ